MFSPVIKWLVSGAYLCICSLCVAQPDLNLKEEVQGVELLRDAVKPDLFYYLPTELKVKTDLDGRPYFRFVQMRYTGTHLSGDQGSHRFRSLLSLVIVNESPSQLILDAVVDELKNKTNRSKITLKPVPVQNIQAVLVYASIDPDTEENESTKALGDGFFESMEEDAEKRGAFWKERNFVLKLDQFTAQAFWEAFTEKQSLLSVGYGFAAKVKADIVPELSFSGDSAMVASMKQNIGNELEDVASEDSLNTIVIKTGAFNVEIDLEKWPDLMKQVDINEELPPEYPVLDVFCFDFNNEIRDDIYVKRIEIEAVGAANKPVVQKYTFKKSSPDIYARSIKFPYAVRMDRPYKYRLVEVDDEGRVNRTEWIERSEWNEILDITTRKAEENSNSEED